MEWYNQELTEIRRKCDLLYKTGFLTGATNDWTEYSDAKKTYDQTIQMTKNDFHYNKLQLVKKHQKKTWKLLKQIINGVHDEPSDNIEFDGVRITNKTEMVNNLQQILR